ncbi:MAG: hypothetical protein OEZ68_00700 [Gammaproteobacteria bacterium]|nr:hypothetical protein [Gammaproteobacteria bacterium]MDH5799297.1 hypothetical protein [Gammaproteobacteria bacterium]
MSKILQVLTESIKHNERVIQLAADISQLAREMRESDQRIIDRTHELDKRLVRLESFIEIAEKQKRLPQT